jgi:hypothetical protein
MIQEQSLSQINSGFKFLKSTWHQLLSKLLISRSLRLW